MARSNNRRAARASANRSGFALIAVLLVLLSLLVLATPLLLSARGADQASTRLADRTDARVALDTAARHARAVLAETYGSADQDRTPYFDGQDEVNVGNAFPDGFLDANDAKGAMWKVDSRDVAGLVDLDSASPQVLANLLGLTSRLGGVLAADAKEIVLAPNPNFEPQGFLWIAGEMVQVRKVVDNAAVDFTRGVFGPTAGSEWLGGPMPSSSHGIGTPVIDQRAYAPVLWRLASSTDELRAWESVERLPECASFALAAATDSAGLGVMRDTLLRRLREFGTTHGGLRAGVRWQRAARLTAKVAGGKDGKLRLDDARWFNPGATVRIRDGESTEFALVQSVLGNGEIALDRVLKNDYVEYEAVVDVLARRPVNLNTAPREVLAALFLNLQVAGQNSRVTADEADQFAALVIESRPFTGFQDFLERAVLPAAGIAALPGAAPVAPVGLRGGEAFLDKQDAIAVYANGLNANDATLAWSTMPYAFTTRDVYALELRAAINAESGVLRYAAVRDDVLAVAPQRELTRLWARQEDFDEELRLGREAAWWLTGPEATSQWDDGVVPPSRLWPELGTFEGKKFLPGVSDDTEYASRETPPSPKHTFPSRDDTSWSALMPTRLAETARLIGRVEHFDHETRDVEGRFLPDQTLGKLADDDMVRWNTPDERFLRSSGLSMWIRPRSLAGGRFVDVGGTSPDVDRMTLSLDGDDLVLRVVDGFGDHRDTTFPERGEMRYSVSKSPGLPVDVWSHVEFDVRGNRPSQMHMLVNGLAHGVRTPGLTRLTGGLAQNASTLAVESTEGFPERCVVRVGNELIEVTVAGGAMSAKRVNTGPMAGFGGRMAREEAAFLTEDAASPPQNLAGISTDHAAGTPVELYGYSLPIRTDVPTGEARLARPLGKFRVSKVESVVGGAETLGDPISVGLFSLHLGFGMSGTGAVTGLNLKCADDGYTTTALTPPDEYMSAFHPDGGYAAIVQTDWSFNGQLAVDNGTPASPIGGIEIIRYSGWTGTTLQIAERGVVRPNYADITNQGGKIGGKRTFVTNWDAELEDTNQVVIGQQLNWQVFVVPISLSVPGASDVRGFLAAQKEHSRFAQLTHVADAELTEWVRYDSFDTARMQLVRDDPNALLTVFDVLVGVGFRVDPPGPGGGGTGGGGTGGGGTGGGGAKMAIAVEPAAEPLATPAARPQTYSTTVWDPRVGENENDGQDHAISRAVETFFQFRGVFGTYSHTHPSGTLIHPVFEVDENDPAGGRPGRLDAVFLSSSDPTHPGWPLIVQRAHTPATKYATRRWRQPQDLTRKPIPVVPSGDAEYVTLEDPYPRRTYVAFQARSPENVVETPRQAAGGLPMLESREISRIVLFPSGERPRAVGKVQIGGSGDGTAVVPSALVDEVAFGDAQFGRASSDPEATCGASFVLDADLDEGGNQITVRPKSVRIALSDIFSTHEFLPDIPANGGLLRIGDEIVAYREYDAQSGVVRLASDGRGKLGTKAGAHETYDPVMYLEYRVATVLTAGAGAGDSSLQIANIDGFPQQGLVLVGDELIHYTRIRGTTLEMPRSSTAPGAMDQRGDGLFRGRFGTSPAGHASGDAVILFPVRYPDLWARRADAPELAYFGFHCDQPAAFWNSVYFKKQDTDSARIGMLVRTDPNASWDADPETDTRLRLLWQGDTEGKPIAIGHQADALSARVFVEYQKGAFDATNGVGHGWRQTPKLTLFGAFYMAPNVTLRSVER